MIYICVCLKRRDLMNENKENLPWLDGYSLETLKYLYSLKKPIEQNEKEEYKNYFEYANENYNIYRILYEHKELVSEILVSNYGNIIVNGKIIKSTLVKDGPNKGYNFGKNDNYKEIVFPEIKINKCIFTYRLVAEVWCNNEDVDKYTTVHHIGNDEYDIKNNLLFVTSIQHGLIHGWIK